MNKAVQEYYLIQPYFIFLADRFAFVGSGASLITVSILGGAVNIANGFSGYSTFYCNTGVEERGWYVALKDIKRTT